MEVSEYYQKMKVLAAELRYCWHCSALCYRGCRCYTCGADNWGRFCGVGMSYLIYLCWSQSRFIYIWIEVLSVQGGRKLKDNSGVIRLITICKILLHHCVRIPDYRPQWISCLKLQNLPSWQVSLFRSIDSRQRSYTATPPTLRCDDTGPG